MLDKPLKNVDKDNVASFLKEIVKMIKDDPNEWSMKITRANNGFIVETKDDGIVLKNLFENRDDSNHINNHRDFEDLKIWREMLYFIMENFGYYPSKHDDKRIVIRIEDRDGNDVNTY